jgi:hypothetical protein
MSKDLKKKLLEKQKEIAGEKLVYPLTRVQIDQKEGKFKLVKDGELIGHLDKIEMVIVDRYAEFYAIDPEKGKRVITSTIEAYSGDCVDRRTGIPIKELKETLGDKFDIIYEAHLIGVLLNHDKEKQVTLHLHGSGVKEFFEFLSRNKDYWSNRLTQKVVLELDKARKLAVTYYKPVITTQEITDEREIKDVLDNIDEVKEKFENFRQKFNSRINNKKKEDFVKEVEEVEEFVSEEEEEDFIDYAEETKEETEKKPSNNKKNNRGMVF